MNAIQILGGDPWVGRLGWALIQFLWQGAVIAGIYAVARNAISRPQARYFLACTALIAMVAAPLGTFVRETSPDAISVSGTHSHVVLPTPSEWSTTPISSVDAGRSSWLDDVMPWLVSAWLFGAGAFWLRLAAGLALVYRVRSTSVCAVEPKWRRVVERLSKRIRISTQVKLLTSARVEVPITIGWLRPVILMPVGALAGLPANHIEALLTHELAHIRRHDYLVNILQRIAETMLFYHPAVWWISRQIRQERELCCDDIAVSVTGDAFAYAEVLADLETSRQPALNSALAANGASLQARIAHLLDIREKRIAWYSTPAAVSGLFIFMVIATLAQPAAPAPRFEVASIKLSPPEYAGFQSYVRGDTYMALTATVRNLITYAYGIQEFQISGGPAWTSSTAYNISAKMDSSAKPDDSRLMLQGLLAERFGLTVHRVTRNRPGYALVVDKSGPKLSESKTGGPGLGLGRGRLNGRGADMHMLANQLSAQIEAPIADRTGLAGRYDFTLVWSPDQTDASEPSLFTAVKEQLGLRLEPVKNVPVELFIIDRVQKPSEN